MAYSSTYPSSVLVRAPFDAVQQLRRVERLHQEVHGAVLKRLLPDVLVVVSGDENDRQLRARSSDPTLQLETVHTWQPHVGKKTRRLPQNARFQERLRGSEDNDLVSR